MRIEQQPAYVLHSRPYRETSLLLECLTRDHGRLGVVARGVRRERARLQRAQLEPFQLLSLDLMQRGELATLQSAEGVGAPLRLVGDAGLAGLYLNELAVRLTGRQDPLPELFDAYARTLPRLAGGEPLAWSLRRFERDLLEAVGYALQLEFEAESGEPVESTQLYRYVVEQGPMPCRAGTAHALRGADLIALAADVMPDAAGLSALRTMMREVIRFHLGGGELRAWHVLGAAMSRR
ncbi:DNA replication and repair protein RecO [Dyella jiangningensis]|uniref:DNA repair protein RecO n=1 Tax=Dyella sp. AtDHG13 TaxID=1938897 RepID=UPI0008829E4A|nr:DNA repair protein RecO [Dyella sp. AtDHG13]PXV61381.1 DNA replication and repair protein RecO [Dyella sp. AtDHG13]SDJ92157.1 DNA replication and repair protein RecO [Dyella jiangningensis]